MGQVALYHQLQQKQHDQQMQLFLFDISSFASTRKVSDVLPVCSSVVTMFIISPARAVEMKSTLSIKRVTQTLRVSFLECIPALSSIHRRSSPPCKVPCAFKFGEQTKYLNSNLFIFK